MENTRSPSSQKLLEAFSRFRRLHWHHSPVEGLRPSEFWVLVAVKRARETGEPGIRISDLARWLDVATPTATQLVKRLEGAEYVERTHSAVDRRTVNVALTKKGRSVLETARKDLMVSFDELVDFLGEDDSARLADLLGAVSDFFKSKHGHDT